MTLEREDWLLKDCIMLRNFNLQFNGCSKQFSQLQVLNWPDHSVPEDDSGYLTIEYVLSSINEQSIVTPQSPILIHCSAGTGRTGTAIALYNIIKSMNIIRILNLSPETQNNQIKPFFSVFNVVRKLREQRISMVSSYSQYKFIYDFVIEWIKRNCNLVTGSEMITS
jgi:protein tyrosine phosphatase